jgi:hypothetical protein
MIKSCGQTVVFLSVKESVLGSLEGKTCELDLQNFNANA